MAHKYKICGLFFVYVRKNRTSRAPTSLRSPTSKVRSQNAVHTSVRSQFYKKIGFAFIVHFYLHYYEQALIVR